MIPKIIHCCWFGEKELPELEQRCIESWRKVLPDYTIKVWNESNFDVSCCLYVKQAYEKGKFAFVSDYARIFALYSEGGIYLDTDVEVLKPLGGFLNKTGFLGFENKTFVGTALMAFQKKNGILKEMLDYYNQTNYIDNEGQENLTTNVSLLNKILIEKGLTPVNSYQEVMDIAIYERDYFFPKKITEQNFRITDNTFTIHRMKGSWLTDRQKKRGTNKFWINVCRPVLRCVKNIVISTLGENKSKKIEIKIRNFLK